MRLIAILSCVAALVFAFSAPAQAQAGPWHLTTTQCFGMTGATVIQNRFDTDLSGNPMISVDEATQIKMDCVSGKWFAKTFMNLSECATEATAMQAEFDDVNALGYWTFSANCWAPADACTWMRTIYPSGQLPQEALDWLTANNCPTGG